MYSESEMLESLIEQFSGRPGTARAGEVAVVDMRDSQTTGERRVDREAIKRAALQNLAEHGLVDVE